MKSQYPSILGPLKLFLVSLALLLVDNVHIEVVEGAMRLVLQRVRSASVRVEGETVSQIGPGVMALVGLHENDNEDNIQECCKKLLAAKMWANDNGGQWR